jgi:hypothetical protein
VSGSPVGLDRLRVGNKQPGDLFRKDPHICRGTVSQILNQNQIISALFEGKLLRFFRELLNCRNGQLLVIGTMRSDHLDLYEQSSPARSTL